MKRPKETVQPERVFCYMCEDRFCEWCQRRTGKAQGQTQRIPPSDLKPGDWLQAGHWSDWPEPPSQADRERPITLWRAISKEGWTDTEWLYSLTAREAQILRDFLTEALKPEGI